mgnify:CR=1 FL=1
MTELNIGLQTAVEFLKNKRGLGDINDEANLSTKISDEQYKALVNEFKVDKDIKNEAERIFAKKNKEKKAEKKEEKKPSQADELKTANDKYLRLMAEYDNYRKRTTKEKENIYQDAKGDTIKDFLAVYDNLERAAASEGGEDSPHKKGLEMIFQQYKDILAKLGVTEIKAKGQSFDPEKMNAVMHIDDENFGENEVAQVFQAGFELNGKVIRHGSVQVAN